MMPARKGDTWNESSVYKDAWTLRECRRLTTLGEINQTPNYHTNIGFTADSETLVFWTKREDRGAVCKVQVATGDITQLTDPVANFGYEPHIQGGPYPRMCLAPQSRWLVYTEMRTLRAVHLDTLEEKTLIREIGTEWEIGYPSVSADEQFAILPLSPMHPQVAAGARVTASYFEHFSGGESMRFRLLQVPLMGGESEVVYQEEGCRSFHSVHSPVNNDLILIDRDFPPRYWGGSDGKTTRIWTLRLSSGVLTELASQDANCFQVHAVWTWDGENIIYHGQSASGGHFIGLCDQGGKTVREWDFSGAPHYGHISAMAGRPALILDGNLSNNLLMWLYYNDDQPRVEVIAAHDTQWDTILGQAPHPHPLSSPDGRWISFNRARNGRTEIVVVRV
jgi:hypothetical protein